MRDHDDLTDRLGQLASGPVPDDIRDGHLHAMRAAVPAPDSPRRFGKLAVAAATLVGFAAGSTGFAMAGALPDPAQGVAHDVLAVVQVEVPDRPQNRGACVSAAAKVGDHEAKAACKDIAPPGRSGEAPGRSGEAPGQKDLPPDHPNSDTSDCKGKPPWAGKGRGPEAQEETARGQCPPDADEDPAVAAEEQRREEAEDAAEAEAEAQAEAEERRAEGQEQPEPPASADAGTPELPDPAQDPAQENEPAGGETPPESTPEDQDAG